MGCSKRPNDSDSSLYSSDLTNESNKKRVVPMEVESEIQNAEVAGPTKWALGDK